MLVYLSDYLCLLIEKTRLISKRTLSALVTSTVMELSTLMHLVITNVLPEAQNPWVIILGTFRTQGGENGKKLSLC